MNKLIKLLAVAAMAFTGAFAHASEKLIMATGDLKGGSTYAVMGEELVKMCSKDNIVTQQTTGGGTTNRELLVGNKVTMAILQSDMLEFTKRTDPAKVQNIRTLIPLHSEEVHIIARSGVIVEGGYLGGRIGGTEIIYNTVDNLAGRTVGAVGGSVDTANVISRNSGLNFKVQRFNNNDELKQALLGGGVDAIVVVAGAPSQLVASLPNSFKLLPIGKNISQKLIESKLYNSARLSYENLRAAGVETVSVQAVVATRLYRSSSMISQLKDLRQCFYEKLGDIQDARGTHPKWQDVSADVKSGWQWYDL